MSSGESVMCKVCVCNSDWMFFENWTDGRTDRATARSPIGLKNKIEAILGNTRSCDVILM